MGYIEGEDRKQTVLFPEVLDDYISEENPVRFIEVFIEGLDLLGMGFQKAIPKDTGRPPYDPGDLLRLYVYGYLNRTRSSRRLETEAGRNVEVMWLMRKLRPDFKTIADFRKDNAAGIKKVCREFTLWCKRLELFGGELVAIDGSKFGAVNSPKRNFTEKKLRRMIKEIDAKIDQYLKQLDQQDKQEAGQRGVSPEQLKEKIEQYKQRRAQYEQLKTDLEGSAESQISLTDPQSRSMRVGHGVEVSYNVQIMVDHKHKLVVEHEVTNEVTDQGQLSTMAKKAQETLGVQTLEVVADRGYYSGEEVKACEQSGMTVYAAGRRGATRVANPCRRTSSIGPRHHRWCSSSRSSRAPRTRACGRQAKRQDTSDPPSRWGSRSPRCRHDGPARCVDSGSSTVRRAAIRTGARRRSPRTRESWPSSYTWQRSPRMV